MCRTFPDGPVCHMCGGRFTTGDHPEEPAQQAVPMAERARLAAMRTLIATDRGDVATKGTRDRRKRR